MIALPSTQTLQVVLGAAKSTTDMQYTATWVTRSSGAIGRANGNTNGVTDVDVVSAPSSGDHNLVKQLTVYNCDTASKQVTVKLDQSGTETILYKYNLPVGATLFYSPESGFQILGVANTDSFGVSFCATSASGMSFSAETSTKIDYGTEQWDTGGYYDTTLYRFTPLLAGKYRLSASCLVVGPTDQLGYQLVLKKNNSEAKIFYAPASGSGLIGLFMTSLELANGTTDYFEMYLWCATSGALINSGFYNYFCGEYVSD
jgi:hypothetical protein